MDDDQLHNVQRLCVVAWSHSVARILKAHCIVNDLSVNHDIPTEDMEALAKEFSSKKPFKDSVDVQTYYRAVSGAERQLTLEGGEHDRLVLENIKYLHNRHFDFPSYPTLRTFLTTHLGHFLE